MYLSLDKSQEEEEVEEEEEEGGEEEREGEEGEEGFSICIDSVQMIFILGFSNYQ